MPKDKDGRIFTYSQQYAKMSVKTAPDSRGNSIAIEITSNGFINVAFNTLLTVDNQLTQGWTSIEKGEQLNDLITALEYHRDIGLSDD